MTGKRNITGEKYMKITKLDYADGNNIAFGDNWAIRVAKPDDEYRSTKDVASIEFISSCKRDVGFTVTDSYSDDLLNRAQDIYKVTLLNGKVVVLPADKYMALYE